MKEVAKLVIIDPEDKYLLLYRSNHPVFGTDPDLPGGTIEENETLVEALLREVVEEAGLEINGVDVSEVYSGFDYSKYGEHFVLFTTKLQFRPEIKISWEHSSYEWLGHKEFLRKAKEANDVYMHMVHDVLASR